MHQKQHVKAFNQHEREQGRTVAGSHEQALKGHYALDAKIYYIVNMCDCNGHLGATKPGKGAKIFGHILVGLQTRT